MYDIAIIGAGPSGATLARLLNKKMKILLIDKRDFYDSEKNNTNSRVKCCGGLLAPDAQKMLATLGLGIPKEILVGPQLFTVRTIDFDNKIEKFYQRSYINIDRERFDSYLLSQVSENVDIKLGAVFKGFQEVTDGYEIEYYMDGNINKSYAKILVGADGAASKVRDFVLNKKTLNKKTPNENLKKANTRYVSIQETYLVSESLPYFTSVFDREISDFYSWVIPKGNHLFVGAAIRENDDILSKFEIFKKKLENKGFQLDNKVGRHGAYIIRPNSFRDISIGEGDIFLVGEAAGFISPSSAEGISYAIKSSMHLAASINLNYNQISECVSLIRKNYKKSCKYIFLNILLKNLKSPIMYNPTFRKIIMKSGILSMNEPLKED